MWRPRPEFSQVQKLAPLPPEAMMLLLDELGSVPLENMKTLRGELDSLKLKNRGPIFVDSKAPTSVMRPSGKGRSPALKPQK